MSDELRELATFMETFRALLIEKGVVTEKEFADRHAQMTSFVDQKFAEAKEKALAAMDPFMRELVTSLEERARSEP